MESNYDAAMLRDGSYPWSLKERILGASGHLSNDDVADYILRGLGEACRTWSSPISRASNNHPELARMSAEHACAPQPHGSALEIAEPTG
jgi:hypothetical protein